MGTRIAIILVLWCGSFVVESATAQVPLPEMRDMQDASSITLSHDVTVAVDVIHALSVSATAVTLTISAATAGSPPSPDSDNSTTYNITTNGSAKKITGALDATYAAGLSLSVLLAAPTNATATQQSLSTTAKDLVTGITRLAESNLTITYTASATTTASPNQGSGGETHTVLMTLIDS